MTIIKTNIFIAIYTSNAKAIKNPPSLLILQGKHPIIITIKQVKSRHFK